MRKRAFVGSLLGREQAHRLAEVDPPLVERPPGDRPVERRPARLERPEVVDGHMTLPDKPGLGLELREDTLEKYGVKIG